MIRDKSEKKRQVKLPKGVIAVASPSFRRERALIKRGLAGRRPRRGRPRPAGRPVVAARPSSPIPASRKGIDDLKRLTAERREELFEEIATSSFAVAFGSPARIDRDTSARPPALARARRARPKRQSMLSSTAATRSSRRDCEAVIGGDGLVMSIAAASIIAKVTRDRLMRAGADPGLWF